MLESKHKGYGCMEMTNEDVVTKILASKEIIKLKSLPCYATNPVYNLGDYLSSSVPEPSKYEGKYFFIK